MSVQTEFLSRLAQLLEFAETHQMEVPRLALNAAFEAISPSLVQSAIVGGKTVFARDSYDFPQTLRFQTKDATLPAPKKGPLHLHVIDGGRP